MNINQNHQLDSGVSLKTNNRITFGTISDIAALDPQVSMKRPKMLPQQKNYQEDKTPNTNLWLDDSNINFNQSIMTESETKNFEDQKQI